jgi:hypothetical protein
MSGWIKIYRGLNNHWIWDNSDYLKWWIDILLEVNHTKAKVLIKGKLYDCYRGDKLYSLDTWAKRWNVNKSKVRRFLELLQKDSMIVLKSETQTTRLTVCNYDSYQENKIESETQTTRKRNANETQTTPIQERKEEKEQKEEKEDKRVNKFTPPTILEVEVYFTENGYNKQSGTKAFNYYDIADWKDSNGKQVRNWKQKMQSVWFKDENKINKKPYFDSVI